VSETIACPTCHKDLPAAFNFCPHCKSQVKCRNLECQQPLVTGVDICVHCGTATQSITLQPLRNKFTRVITQGKYGPSEKTDFDFTDHAATELASAIGGMVLGRQPPQPPYQTRPNHVQAQSLPIALVETSAEQEPGATEPTHESPPPTPVNDDPQGAARFFRRDGDYLLATKKDYKGTTHAEQQRRFILLYASAYEQLFDKSVPNKDHFKAAAEKASILDKNHFTIYLNGLCKQYISESSSGYFVNDDGKPEVERIVAEIDNSSIPAGDAYWNKTPANTTEKYRLPKEDKQRFHGWAKEEVKLGTLDILDIKSGRDYALLAYWLLITHLKKGEGFRWNEAFEYLKTRYQTISVTSNAFSRAVTRDEEGKLFRKNGEAYFLSSDAITVVEKWVSGTSKPGSGDKKKE